MDLEKKIINKGLIGWTPYPLHENTVHTHSPNTRFSRASRYTSFVRTGRPPKRLASSPQGHTVRPGEEEHSFALPSEMSQAAVTHRGAHKTERREREQKKQHAQVGHNARKRSERRSTGGGGGGKDQNKRGG